MEELEDEDKIRKPLSTSIKKRKNSSIQKEFNVQSKIKASFKNVSVKYIHSNELEKLKDRLEVRTMDGFVIPKELAFIVCIDPGVVNFSVCLWDLYSNSFSSISLVAFRETETKVDKYAILGNLKKHIKENYNEIYKLDTPKPFIHIYIEDQNEKVFKGYSNSEVIAIQTALMYKFGGNKSKLVKPSSVKDWFPNIFPEVEDKPGENKENKKSRQYYANKKNSVLFGRPLLPDSVVRNMERIGQKLDDITDSVWIAKYISECFFERYDIITGEKIEFVKEVVSRTNQKAPKERKQRKKKNENVDIKELFTKHQEKELLNDKIVELDTKKKKISKKREFNAIYISDEEKHTSIPPKKRRNQVKEEEEAEKEKEYDDILDFKFQKTISTLNKIEKEKEATKKKPIISNSIKIRLL